MTETPQLTEEMDLLAAELAFDLLDERERIEAERLRLADPAFDARVSQWQRQSEAWLDEPDEQSQPADLWYRIEAGIGTRQRPTDSASGSVTAMPTPQSDAYPSPVWKPLALAASLAAAIFASLWAFTTPERVEVPVEQPFSPQAFSVAQIEGGDSSPILSAMYDRDQGRIYLHLAAIEDPQRVPQLWLVDTGGTPHSLGFGERNSVAELELSEQQRAVIEAGGVLAISLEEQAAQPHEVPSDVLGTSAITPFEIGL